MAATNMLLSRLLDLVRYRQWSQKEVVDLFIALLKQYNVRAEKTDFYTWMAKILYQMEIHNINHSDLLTDTHQSQFVPDIQGRIETFKKGIKKTTEENLKEILEEIGAGKDIDQKTLNEVKEIVLFVSSSSSCSKYPNLKEKKEALLKLCKAVEDTKEWKPRLTQMVSWCIMVLSGSSQLIQVGTGEGKSCIVAMFAAYCAMTEGNVDIISSSPVLAARDAKEWRSFYNKLGITVDDNTDKHGVEELRKCYACQVVYGTTKSFSGDWLRDRFQRENVRCGRQFKSVIVDEVDSLMLDKGLEIVYLNSEMPVMERLNVILANIWFVVNQFENLEVEETLVLVQSLLMTKDSEILPLKKYLEIPTNISRLGNQEFHIPGFLEHINGRLKIWIENAFLAKTMILGQEYILHEDGVVPVDYSSTGVVQNDMKWGDGLQQFLEMKHQTRLSNMSMITNFKSNVNLFRSYNRIYGLTGTLGNQTELGLLEKLYPGIKTCKIPPFKRRKLYEKDGIVITDENDWVQTICKVVNENVNPTVYRGSRAVLVICETIQRAQIIHNALSKTISANKLKLYTNNNMDNSKVLDEEVTEGCVIVATNLAGRGTDLKVCTAVNDSGGLFVVQTFLPLNIRVQQQAFGRTAREGNPGSAQLIMCSTHFSKSLRLLLALKSPLMLLTLMGHLRDSVVALGLIDNRFEETLKICRDDPNEKNCEAMAEELKKILDIQKPGSLTSLELEKESRNFLVQIRLSGFLEDDIPKITKKEELFSEYLKMLDSIYKRRWPWRGDHKDIVSSLHECWGMWLLMKFNENESTETLKEQLKKDLQSAKEKLERSQSPSSMIYHYVRTGNTLHQKGSLEDSIDMYTRAIKNNPCWPAIALYNHALSILSKANNGHIAQALADLKKAEEAVNWYMRQLKLTMVFVKTSSKAPTMTSDTLFTKQFEAKQLVQQLLKSNIQQAIEVLQRAESQGYEVQITKYPVLQQKSLLGLGGDVCKEILNLHSLGLDTFFLLETVFSFFKRLSKIFS